MMRHWSVLLGLAVLLHSAPATADLQSDAGCHSALYVNTFNISHIADSCHKTLRDPSGVSYSFVPQFVPASERPSAGPCSGNFPHLFIHTCPYAALSDAGQCSQTDTCPLVGTFPAKFIRSFAQEYYVQAAVASEAHFFVLTTDTSQSSIRIYRCTLDLTSCLVADVPSSIPPIFIAGSPSLGATLTPDGGPATQLHITYETWTPVINNIPVAIPYVMWISVDIGLSTFTLVNVTQAANAPVLNLNSRYTPFPSVVRNFLHIATQEEIAPFAVAEPVVIYSCDWAAATCTRRVVPTAAAQLSPSGPALAHWPLNDYLYVAYIQGAGSYTVEAIIRCALSATGDLVDSDLCADSQFPYNEDFIASGTPSIAFAAHLGAVVVAYANLRPEGLLFVQYDADFSGDAKLYNYITPLAGQVGEDGIRCPALFNIDARTNLMRLAYEYNSLEHVQSIFNLYVGEVDVFPSQPGDQSVLSLSPGYAKWYPPPLRQECLGTAVDVVASCPSVLAPYTNNCVQAWLFSGGDLAQPYFEYQPCYPKAGYGLQAVYPRASNPQSSYACVYLDDSNPPLTYFDDGPSIPLFSDAILNLLLGQIPPLPTPSTDLSSIIATVLPSLAGSTDSLLGEVNPGVLFAATSARLTFWGGGRAHDFCYHNTVHYPGFDKDMCDAMVYKRWALACVDSVFSDIFGIISDLAQGYFPGESIIECEALAFIYYVVLRTSEAAQQAYLSSNSDVDSPQFSDIPDGLGDFAANNAPDPSLIKQNAELINSTIYTDNTGQLRVNLTQYSALLLSNPLIPSPAPPPAPYPPGAAAPSPSSSPSSAPALGPTPSLSSGAAPSPIMGTPAAPASPAPAPVPTGPPSLPVAPMPSPAPASPTMPIPSPSPTPVPLPVPSPTPAVGVPEAPPSPAPTPAPTAPPSEPVTLVPSPVPSPMPASPVIPEPSPTPAPVAAPLPVPSPTPAPIGVTSPPVAAPAAVIPPDTPGTSPPVEGPNGTPSPVVVPTMPPVSQTLSPVPSARPVAIPPSQARARPAASPTPKPRPTPRPASSRKPTPRKPVSGSVRGSMHKPAARPTSRAAHKPSKGKPVPRHTARPAKKSAKARPVPKGKPVGHKSKPVRRPPAHRPAPHKPAPHKPA